jgi:hypothetical protein
MAIELQAVRLQQWDNTGRIQYSNWFRYLMREGVHVLDISIYS